MSEIKYIKCRKKSSKGDELCKAENIEHRLTKSNSPKTNGMVERVNGIIKNETVLLENYTTKEEMNSAVMTFLIHYIFYRRQ